MKNLLATIQKKLLPSSKFVSAHSSVFLYLVKSRAKSMKKTTPATKKKLKTSLRFPI